MSTITQTGGWMVFGLRPEYPILQGEHIGNLDRSPIIAAGSTAREGKSIYPLAACIDAEHDFPET